MKRSSLSIILYAVIGTAIYGCAGTKQTANVPPVVDPPCTVSDATFNNHIAPRHCQPVVGANQLLPEYCVDAASAQVFCRMVQNAPAPNRIRVVQADGRVRYDANLGQVVGTAGERCGRVIITSVNDGAVVTEFPETDNAPPPCL